MKYQDSLDVLRDLLDGKVNVTGLSNGELADVVAKALEPPEPFGQACG